MENKTSTRIFQFPAAPHKLFKTNMFQPNQRNTVEAVRYFLLLSILIYCGKKAPKYNQF
jgi:hypothetical protein